MNTFVPSVIYRSPRSSGFVGEDITSFSSVPTFSGTSASLSGSGVRAASPAATGFSWGDLTKGLLNIGGTVATGLASISLQKAQIKANASASRPVIVSAPASTPTFFPSNPSATGSSGINKTLLYGGGALAIGLIAFIALRKK